MTGTLKSERQAVADAITAEGFEAFDHLPARLNAPCAVITAGSPYIEPSDAFGGFNARFGVLVIVRGSGDNAIITDDMDARLEEVATRLRAEGFGLERISEPGKFTLAGVEFLGAVIDVTTGVTFP